VVESNKGAISRACLVECVSGEQGKKGREHTAQSSSQQVLREFQPSIFFVTEKQNLYVGWGERGSLEPALPIISPLLGGWWWWWCDIMTTWWCDIMTTWWCDI